MDWNLWLLMGHFTSKHNLFWLLKLHYSFSSFQARSYLEKLCWTSVLRHSVNNRLLGGAYYDRASFLVPVLTPCLQNSGRRCVGLPSSPQHRPQVLSSAVFKSHCYSALNLAKMPLAVGALDGSISLFPVFLLLCFRNVAVLINWWWFLSFAPSGCAENVLPCLCLQNAFLQFCVNRDGCQYLTLSHRKALLGDH